jgi:hypothetical protein
MEVDQVAAKLFCLGRISEEIKKAPMTEKDKRDTHRQMVDALDEYDGDYWELLEQLCIWGTSDK